MSKLLFLLLTVISTSLSLSAQTPEVTEGRLFARDKQGPLGFCPLKSTKVRADISGFFARVTVVQEFENSYGDPIEAVYTFPLSQNSAVDNMTMTIGERIIRGKIMKREEARKVYEAAKSAGQAAALLDQQRPNIFTQSVANIMPGEKITVEISYVETLKFEEGQYEFVFPMVVGPRYSPASMIKGEAAKINPPVSKERAGHDISIEVNLDAGVPIELVRSISHQIETTPLSAEKRKIELKDLRTIPNKDFILRYDVTGKRIEDAILMHRGAKGGFFTMMLQPPDSFAPKDVTPKEIVFVLDTSGSMNGFPIEKAKEAMRMSLDGLYPQDTFNLITFAGDTSVLFPSPVRATDDNLARAREFLASRKGGGGTEMMNAITAALAPTESQTHIRIVCFMTDGYVSNEPAIIAEVQKYQNARVFAFGIGNSVNRYLLDKMASEGRGEVEYVSLKDDGSKAAKRFHERIRSPLLTDISIDWNRFGVSDVYPGRQADLFSAKPVALTGRFTKTGAGSITLKGKMAGLDYHRDIPVNFPESGAENDQLATIWARMRVDELMSKYYGAKEVSDKKTLENEITQIGLEFRLMTQFTSFVAVEEKIVNQDGRMVKVEVPVHLAEGTFGSATGDLVGTGSGFGSGTGSGNPHGYITQGVVSKTKSRVAEVSNNPANVTGLSVTVPKTAPAEITQGRGTANTFIIDGASGPGVIGAVLARISAHQRALRSLRSDIKVTSVTTGIDETEVREGKLINLAGDANGSSIRIDWKKPEEESLSVVGSTFTVYQPKLAQVTIGKTGDETAMAVLPGLNMGKADLKLSFDINYLGVEEVSPGVQTWRLELKRKGNTDLKPIYLWVDNTGMIVQGKFTEKDGGTITVLLTKPEKNITLKPEDFNIVYPKETKVIRDNDQAVSGDVPVAKIADPLQCLSLPLYVRDPLELVGLQDGVSAASSKPMGP